MSVKSGNVEVVDVQKKLKKQTDEERRLAEMMIPKKKKRLYQKIMHARKRKAKEVKVQWLVPNFLKKNVNSRKRPKVH